MDENPQILSGGSDEAVTATVPEPLQVSPGDRVVTPPHEDVGRRGARRRFWRELPFLVGVALVLSLLVKMFLVQPFYIPSESMENTLRVGDRILVDKISYRFHDIGRGDIVVFDGVDSFAPEVQSSPSPGGVAGALRHVAGWFGVAPRGERDFVKRVIGLPGDRVRCCDPQGRVTVNGVPLDEPYLYPGDVPSADQFDVRVPTGKLWVMGDHRVVSQDSRAHLGDPGGGFVPEDKVIGRTVLVFWPTGHWGRLSRPGTFADSRFAAATTASLPYALGFAGAVPVAALRHRVRRRVSRDRG